MSKNNYKMTSERWKEACKASCNAANYRKDHGYTDTKDDAFVDGVQWADENPPAGRVHKKHYCKLGGKVPSGGLPCLMCGNLKPSAHSPFWTCEHLGEEEIEAPDIN